MTEVELGRMELGRNQYVVALEFGIFQGRPNSETVKIRPMAQEADSTHFRSPMANAQTVLHDYLGKWVNSWCVMSRVDARAPSRLNQSSLCNPGTTATESEARRRSIAN